MKLYGKNPVLERLKTNPKSIRLIYIQEKHEDQTYIQKKARQWGIPFTVVPKTKIQKLARNVNNQGLVADVTGFPYDDYADLLNYALEKKMCLLFCDGLTDPQNLGGILRSLACLGDFVLVLSTKDSVSVSEAAMRVACGGENYVKVSQVSNLSRAIKAAQDKGFWITATVVGKGDDIRNVKLNFPLGIIIGSEQKGVRDVIAKCADAEVTLPMANQRMSMNAAHAATLFCYEIVRQKNQNV